MNVNCTCVCSIKLELKIKKNEQHQDSLGLLGSERNLSDGVATQCEAFICDLYPSSRMKPRTVDELRCFLFCQNRKQKNELLPELTIRRLFGERL